MTYQKGMSQKKGVKHGVQRHPPEREKWVHVYPPKSENIDHALKDFKKREV